MKNFILGVLLTLGAVLLMGADGNRPVTMDGLPLYNLRVGPGLRNECFGQGTCIIEIDPNYKPPVK